MATDDENKQEEHQDSLFSQYVVQPPTRFVSRHKKKLLFSAGVTVLALVEGTWSPATSSFFTQLADGKILTTPRKIGEKVPAQGVVADRNGYTKLDQIDRGLIASGEFERVDVPGEWLDRNIPGICHMAPLFDVKAQTGLTITGANDNKLFDNKYPRQVYQHFKSIPPSLVNMLLLVENKELRGDHPETWNYAVEWDRTALSAFILGYNTFIGSHIDLTFKQPGGGTLAQQLEKIRNSLENRTRGSSDKICQIFTATTRAYIEGPSTLAMRQKTILDYINVAPMGARSKIGEITGFADGMRDVFGIDFDYANKILRRDQNSFTDEELLEAARVYRAALSMVMMLQRPSDYSKNTHRLDERIASHRSLMIETGTIQPRLFDAIQKQPHVFADPVKQNPYIPPRDKATDLIRIDLMQKIGEDRLQVLDLMDIDAKSTLDGKATAAATDFIKRITENPELIREAGLIGENILSDPEAAKHLRIALTIFETLGDRRALRVQADNIKGQFNMNEKSKMDLGSTWKPIVVGEYLLRMSYMYNLYCNDVRDAVEILHKDMCQKSPDELKEIATDKKDTLTKWAVDYLSNPEKDRSLQAMVDAAMERVYSGNPNETFFTDSGLQRYSNYTRQHDGHATVRQALAESRNLALIRVLRDVQNNIVQHEMDVDADILTNPDNPSRQKYLKLFADDEGTIFQWRAYKQIRDIEPDKLPDFFADKIRKDRKTEPSARQLSVIYTTLNPAAKFEDVEFFIKTQCKSCNDKDDLKSLYDTYANGKSVGGVSTLNDRAYILRIHPLDLVLAQEKIKNPDIRWDDTIDLMREARIASYDWLLKSQKFEAQNRAIRIMLEKEAFGHLYQSVKKKGFPFSKLVDSLATAIGASGATPDFLADFSGMVQNDGLRKAKVRYESVAIGINTPYQRQYRAIATPEERVMPTEVAKTLKSAMIDVVEEGTARRLKDAVKLSDGTALPVFGKTGTSDGLLETNDGGLKSQGRNGVFMFGVGDKFHGTLVVNVPGKYALKYKFTSAIAAQMVKYILASTPEIQDMLDRAHGVIRPKIRSVVLLPEDQIKKEQAIPPMPEIKDPLALTNTIKLDFETVLDPLLKKPDPQRNASAIPETRHMSQGGYKRYGFPQSPASGGP